MADQLFSPAVIEMLQMLMKATSIEQYCTMIGDVAALGDKVQLLDVKARQDEFRKMAREVMRRFPLNEEQTVQMLTSYLHGPQINRPVDGSTQRSSRT